MNTCSDPQFDLEMNYVVERIENRRVRKGQLEYFVKWQDFPNSDWTWKKPELLNWQELIKDKETNLNAAKTLHVKYLETVATVGDIAT